MNTLTVADVRTLPADSCFLIDDGETAIVYDTGFGFTGFQVAENIRKVLGKRQPDYIFLTHSHYDHALGTPYLLRHFPHVQVVASSYTQRIFAKSSAKAVMRQMDQSFAECCGVTQYDDLTDELKVDIVVEDGDVLQCGKLRFVAVALPGHTKCSMGFYAPERKLLLSTETLGVYLGEGILLPSCLVSYPATLASFQKAKALEIEQFLLPHYGLLSGAKAATYLEQAEAVTIGIAQEIHQMLLSGKTKQEILEHHRRTYYLPQVQAVYPLKAFELNTGIMIDLIAQEGI